MTRYARAKGSKASNERTPNDATPWHVMKEQLAENLSKAQHSTERSKSAKELLKEKDDPFYCDTIGNVNNDWAEFEETNSGKEKTVKGKSTKKESSKKDKKSKRLKAAQETENVSLNETTDSVPNEKQKQNNKSKEKPGIKRKVENSEDTLVVEAKKKKPTKGKGVSENIEINKDKVSRPDVAIPKTPKKKKQEHDSTNETNQGTSKPNDLPKKKKNKKSSANEITVAENTSSNIKNDHDVSSNPEDTPRTNAAESEAYTKLSKRQKRNMRKKNKHADEENGATSQVFNVTGNDWSTSIKQNDGTGKTRPINDSKDNKETMQKFRDGPNNSSNFGKKNFGNNKIVKRKPPKIRDDKEHKRRKPDAGPVKMTINGVEVEVVKYDGFPVKKEDAERLKDLKQQMIMKGIPKPEINAAMKLERRKAEKALARIRKCVCFHCRKSGHNLSDCPELGAEQAGTGICFKCGSTEHTHFECKVAKPTEYRYATCFICREQGHIAKQCPDNPKGVYPQGGACKICGDVTHLKKDCPDLAKEKEETAITLDTIANGTLESLEKDTNKTGGQSDANTKQKVVKF